MKQSFICFLWLISISCFSIQIFDDFSDGNFTENLSWTGTTENFRIDQNTDQLRLNGETYPAYLATESPYINNVEWSADFKMTNKTTNGNHFRFFLMANTENLNKAKGYFVLIGNTEHSISLCRQDQTEKFEYIIKGEKEIFKSGTVGIKVTRDSSGIWNLYADNTLIGSTVDNTYQTSAFCGFLINYSASNNKAYFIDNFSILELGETFKPENSTEQTTDDFSKIVINEVMFNASDECQEFIELFNNSSNDIKNIGELKITVKKSETDTIKKTYSLPNVSLPAQSYLALCKNPEIDSIFFNCPKESRFATMKSWPALNNEGAILYLLDKNKNEIDRFPFSGDNLHQAISYEKCISIERINPNLPATNSNNIASASTDANYGTPGFQNSQYRDSQNIEVSISLGTDHFSPNNDGIDDLLQINYQTSNSNWQASIDIYSSEGKHIISLCKNEILGTQGSYYWDGYANHNQESIGIYIARIELIDISSGDKKLVKKPFVLSGWK